MLVHSQEGFKVEEKAGVVQERRVLTLLLVLLVLGFLDAFIIVSEQIDDLVKEAFADLLDF